MIERKRIHTNHKNIIGRGSVPHLCYTSNRLLEDRNHDFVQTVNYAPSGTDDNSLSTRNTVNTIVLKQRQHN